MSEQFGIAFPTARQLAEMGMAKTLEAEREEWITGALDALKRFASLPEWETFKLEDFRAWWPHSPHDHHVYGAFTNRACKAGIIRFTGNFARSVSPRTHGHYVKIWTRG